MTHNFYVFYLIYFDGLIFDDFEGNITMFLLTLDLVVHQFTFRIECDTGHSHFDKIFWVLTEKETEILVEI